MMSAENDRNSQPAEESGRPGGGRGRQDEVGGSGVYPASAGNAPDDVEFRTQAEWGQGDRGAEGYEDSGQSELNLPETEGEPAEDREL
jgi:hypothetical protein